MATHLSNSHSPSERLAQYRKLSEEARKSAIDTCDAELSTGYLKLAIAWEELADKARSELNAASVPTFWG
jgi:hypothetical protein